ncbi:MAG: hypothetical protein P1U68_04115 [Verrucomicrobiales bacterium]|nr:hypothetical protein [Verrucomicrobiales bacterium]
MKKCLPYVAFAIGIILLGAVIQHHAGELPERIVSRFNGAGKPSGRMATDLFLMTMFWTCLVASANQTKPPRLDSSWLAAINALLIVAAVIWTLVLVVKFTRDPMSLSA